MMSVTSTTNNNSTKKKKGKKAGANEPNENVDYALIKCVGRLVIDILMKCWALSAAAVLAVFLVYCMYGGWFAFLLLCFASAGVIYHAGDWILYHPEQPSHSRLYVPSPHTFGMPFENLFLRTKDGIRINAVFIKQPEAMISPPTVVFLHGNAGNIGHRLVNAKGIYQQLCCNVLMVEYRGYGRSDGTPTEDGLYLDVQAGVDHLLSRKDLDPRKIIVFGRSLGGAIAIDLCSDAQYSRNIMALMVENTFTSIPDMAQVFVKSRLIKILPSWLYKNKFASKSKIGKCTLPTLFISGLADRLIPPRMMRELYTLSGSQLKGLATFESGTHNETWQCDGYYPTLNTFLTKVICSSSQPARVEREDFCIEIPASIA